MNWLHYLLEANLYLGVFYLAYYFILSKETYYTLNRVYLLLSCVISFVLPLLQLGILKPAEPVIQTIRLMAPTQVPMSEPVMIRMEAQPFTWQDGLVYIYLAGAAVLLMMLVFKLYQLIKLTRDNKKQADAEYKVVYLNDSNTAFSFFNFLFIGTRTEGTETIIRHELVHIRQKHSFDIIFIEIIKVINWFNPFVYLVQISLRAIHEYIADEKTAHSEGDTLTYSSFLVSNAYGLSGASITHSFFNYNLLKKRIIMLNQQRSGNLARLKYLVAVPMCAGMLCASTLAFSKDYGWVDIAPAHAKAVADTTPTITLSDAKAHLMVTSGGVTTITDMFSEKRDDGTVKYYTIHNITNADKIALAKKGIIVGVSFDNVTDTVKLKLLPPPPPPAPPKTYGYTAKGFKYKLRKYTISDKMNYVVTIYDKDGTPTVYASNGTPPAQRTMLYNKYGYSFPADGKYGIVKYHVKFPPPVVLNVPITNATKMPPPPPPAPPAKVLDNRPPPPPPFDPAYGALFEYLSKHVRYPAAAFDNEETGNVVVQFNLNSDHKINDVKLVKGSENAFNDEVIRVMKSFAGTINPSAQHPYYLTGVSFNIRAKNGNKLAKGFDKDFSESENYTCVADIYGFTNNDIK